MFGETKAFSGFAVDDIPAAKRFYGETLGLAVTEEYGMLQLKLGSGAEVLVYPKEKHTPASFTILNFPVSDLTGTARELKARGVEFLRYEDVDIEPDADGVYRMPVGPDIAWFSDPAGNTLSILDED